MAIIKQIDSERNEYIIMELDSERCLVKEEKLPELQRKLKEVCDRNCGCEFQS